MKTLYLDCAMGAAGDMLAAALLELLPDKAAFLDRLNGLGLPGVTFRAEQQVKCGVTGTRFHVEVHGEEEGEQTPHHHHHGSMPEISHIVGGLRLPTTVKLDILAVYQLIAEAESRIHGVPVKEIHFHEVGALDAVADITAVCLLMHELKFDRVTASAVHVGSGTVRCAHGILPVPAPATAQLLRGIPIYSGAVAGELCTPTGAALLRYFVDDFGAMPLMRLQSVGYGMGKKDFEQANCVRAMLGETDETPEQVVELQCNLDDMTGEALGFAMDTLLEQGALDVCTIPIGMKKSRPGTMLWVLCREADREKLVQTIFRHTTTLGIRETICRRSTLSRQVKTVQTPLGPVRKKISSGYGVRREKWEYEDLRALAERSGQSLPEIIRQLENSN